MAPTINPEEVSLSQEELNLISGWLSQNPRKLLLIPEVRSHLSQLNISSAFKEQAVKTVDGGRVGTVKHNYSALERGTSLERGSQLFYSIMADNFVMKNKEYLKILVIGPREESEIFSLIGHGFSEKNLSGLDLISYSPFITLGDMHKIPFDDDSFDVVVSSFCLSYSDDAITACKEITRVVRDSGIVVMGEEYQSIHENTDYWATPHRHHWTKPEHIEEFFGDNFGRSIFRCEPTPPLSDPFNKRLGTAFRVKKGRNFNRIIDSLFDEMPAVMHVKQHIASNAETAGLTADVLAVCHRQLDAHHDFLKSRRATDEAAQALGHAQALMGGILDHLISEAVTALFQMPMTNFMERCEDKPASMIVAHSIEDITKALAEDGFCPIVDALAPEALQALAQSGPVDQFQQPAWRRLTLDPSLLRLAEAHLRCPPVIIGAGARPDPATFGFLSGHPRSLRVFVFLSDSDGLTYVRGSHRDRQGPYFARDGWRGEEVVAAYGEDRLVTIAGKAGTIVLTDGGGLLRLGDGAERVAELRLANTAFCGKPARFPLDLLESSYETQLIAQFPRMFQGAFL